MDQQARLKDVAISDSGFLFDPYSGFTFSLNPTGKFILERLRDGLEPEAIEAQLRQDFDVDDAEDLRRDLHEFVLQLRDQAILPREPDR